MIYLITFPNLLKVKSELDFIRLATWWQKVYNLLMPHMELKDTTPYEKLKSLRLYYFQRFRHFPNLNFRSLVDLTEIINYL